MNGVSVDVYLKFDIQSLLKLSTAQRAAVLKGVAEVVDYPTVLSKDELAERAGYAASGGGFNNALGRLRTLELIDGSGMLQLTDAFGEAITS
jgi:hypothetical protein